MDPESTTGALLPGSRLPYRLAECDFKRARACRLYQLCCREGRGRGENNIDSCHLYAPLVLERARKRLIAGRDRITPRAIRG